MEKVKSRSDDRREAWAETRDSGGRRGNDPAAGRIFRARKREVPIWKECLSGARLHPLPGSDLNCAQSKRTGV